MPVPVSALPIFALYAETHFRFFRGFPSLLFRRVPEVVFDMPRRLAPGQDLPVLLVLNDVERFPATLEQVQLSVSCEGHTQAVEFPVDTLEPVHHPLEQRCRAYLLIVRSGTLSGPVVHVNGKAVLRCGTRSCVVLNDNLPGTSKLCMSCRRATDAFPGSDGAVYGDFHTHSVYSESHVEFGPPLAAIDRMCSASGLTFAGVTDHSYDLACSLDDYLQPDPGLARWQAFARQMREGEWRSIMIAGEEVSCLNRCGKVVHLGALGIGEMVPGTLDGARRGRRRERQLSIGEALEAVRAQGGVTFAAHPGARSGLLQSLLLARGVWAARDVESNALDALQGSNGAFADEWRRSRALWTRALLSGRHLPLVAGNDAHGDFSRYRCVGTPFVSTCELLHRHFGLVRTGVYGQPGSTAEVLEGVRSGRTFVTSGPFLSLLSDTGGRSTAVGSTVALSTSTALRVVAESSGEFGTLRDVRIVAGDVGRRRERVVRVVHCPAGTLHAEELVALDSICGERGYVRAECVSEDGDGARCTAATSPVYVVRQ